MRQAGMGDGKVSGGATTRGSQAGPLGAADRVDGAEVSGKAGRSMDEGSVMKGQGTVNDESAAHDEIAAKGEKQVPVSEAIRYRRRAQAAERTVETLQEQLERVEAGRAELARRVEALEAEQALTRQLVQAGARDLEATLLLARQRLGGAGRRGNEQSQEDVEQVVARLRREKPYLFVEERRLSIGPAERTSGARGSIDGRQAAVEQAAQRAKATGDMRDLCEYLRVRRGWL